MQKTVKHGFSSQEGHLAIKARKKFPNQMFTVWGGNLIPAIVILFGITVILCWFGNVFNVLPKFG